MAGLVSPGPADWLPDERIAGGIAVNHSVVCQNLYVKSPGGLAASAAIYGTATCRSRLRVRMPMAGLRRTRACPHAVLLYNTIFGADFIGPLFPGRIIVLLKALHDRSLPSCLRSILHLRGRIRNTCGTECRNLRSPGHSYRSFSGS
jgi:hypothetical protein